MDSPGRLGRLGSPQGACGLHWYVMRGQPAHRWPGLALTRPNIEQSIPFHPKRERVSHGLLFFYFLMDK